MSRARTQARIRALQALYSWQIAQQDLIDIEQYYLTEQDMEKADHDYFHELLFTIPAQRTALEQLFADLLDRPVDQVDPVELAILWIGSYELQTRLDIPYRVVINEAVELAKRFGAEQGHRFINGLLDKVAARARASEVGTDQRPRGTRPSSKPAPKVTVKTKRAATITTRTAEPKPERAEGERERDERPKTSKDPRRGNANRPQGREGEHKGGPRPQGARPHSKGPHKDGKSDARGERPARPPRKDHEG